MHREFCTIGELISKGRIRRETYIEYIPDTNTYVTNPEKTGCSMQKFTNQKRVSWLVRFIEEEDKKILLWPNENLVDDVKLTGLKGFLNGINELNSMCESLGSNEKLGIKAECVTIEDINRYYGYSVLESKKRHAYYPSGSLVTGYITHENGMEYSKKVCSKADRYFYLSDGGGIKHSDEKGNTFCTPDFLNPVFMTETFYEYPIYGEGRLFWLASSCIRLNSSNAVFCLRSAKSSMIIANEIYNSYGGAYSYKRGIRPKICLSYDHLVDIADCTKDGSSPEKAFKLAIDFENIDSAQTINDVKVERNIALAKDEKYKIVHVEAESFIEAILKLEKEVNLFIKDGYEVVGKFKFMTKKNIFICCQQMRLKTQTEG